ncbi:DUF2849 domain-containing protein [Paracoccus luteus]|uniref:DUF2849 domain-containing protein n=1 Tax=Paracoccus luteus TaxID=2508543 RepID=UPI00106F367C|nr:DUF2849 domain-containing protein [Paracoccus luteus]
MSKTFVPSPRTPAVLTGNFLRDGRNVWKAGEDWTTDPRVATLFEDAGLAEFALLDAQAQGHVVVGPYLAEAVRNPDGTPGPAHFREAFRQRGPSTEPSATPAQPLAEVAHV